MGQRTSMITNDSTNEELTNTMIQSRFIRTLDVEKAFRFVDRGLYYTYEDKHIAYIGSCWISNLFHLLAPCVYSTVLECLELHEGLKFLNIGSGVGYFSTVAGLLLGHSGINHGIEIHQPLIDYAYQKLEEFISNAAAVDHYDFCVPIFVQGNAWNLSSTGYYDRVYCGASVPPEKCDFFKALIKVGGILVLPTDGYLKKIIRIDEFTWETTTTAIVQYPSIAPKICDFHTLKFPLVELPRLEELCRTKIRSILRTKIKQNNPGLMNTKFQLKSDARNSSNDQEDLIYPIVIQCCGLSREAHIRIAEFNRRLEDFPDSSTESDSISESDSSSESNSSPESDDSDESNDKPISDSNCDGYLCRINGTFVESDESSTESNKRKSIEAERTKKRTTSNEKNYSKRIKIETTLQNGQSVSSTLSHNRNDLVGTISVPTGPSATVVNADNQIPFVVHFAEDFDAKLWRRSNPLSLHLKFCIGQLPIPNSLKQYLNYT